MYKWIMTALLIVASITGIVVLFNDISDRAELRAAEEAEASKPQLRISASNWKFDKPVYEVEAGSTLPVTLRNAEGVHAIEIVGYDVVLDPNNLSAEVTFDKPGEYEIRCVLACGPGHDDMVSKLIVK